MGASQSSTLAEGDPSVCCRATLRAMASMVGAVKRSATASCTRSFFRIALISWPAFRLQ